jgi:hypothetical protein
MIFQPSDRPNPGTLSKSVRAYLPANLELRHLPAKWLEYGAWLVHHLYSQSHLDRRYRDGKFIPLYSKFLERILPKKDRKIILSSVVDSGVVECNGSYSVGCAGHPGKSTGYRLSTEYREAPFRQHWLHHPELAHKLIRHRHEQEKCFAPVHHHLKAKMNGLEVVGYGTFPLVYLPMVALINRDFRFTVCKQGRVHTNLTNLDKEYRKNLQWNGRPLWLIDIVNSQPLILALTLRQMAHANNHNHNARPDQPSPTKPNPHQPQGAHANKEPSPYVPSLSNNRLSDSDDAQRFLDWCLDGQIYERLGKVAGLSRDDAKKRFFAVAYGGQMDMFTKVGDAFLELFPACFWTIREMKPFQNRFEAGQRKAKDPRLGNLARLMQKLESDIVIGRVCERLRQELPKACLLTIHDCLVTTDEHTDYFARVLKEEFHRIYGVQPRLHINPFAGE